MDLRKIKYVLPLCLIPIAIFYFATYALFNFNKINNKHRFYVPNFSKSIFEVDYLLNGSSCTSDHRILLLITSYIGHVELRSAHRRTFPNDVLKDLNVKRIFLTAKIPLHDKSIIQPSIEDENRRFDDILQGDFMEAYRNLTIKHTMGLRWASDECYNVKFVIKLDDDIVFDLYGLINYLNNINIENRNQFLMGYVMKGMKPIRIKANKWYVSYKEYPKSYYPPFLSGWMYFTTPETAKQLVNAAYNNKYFWIDDLHITGVLATKLGIKLKDIRYDNVLLEYYELLDCCMKDMIDKRVKCEYLAGPNGNDENLIIKFNNALRNCNNCVLRPSDKSLNNTCVSMKNNKPLHRGNPLVNIVKL